MATPSSKRPRTDGELAPDDSLAGALAQAAREYPACRSPTRAELASLVPEALAANPYVVCTMLFRPLFNREQWKTQMREDNLPRELLEDKTPSVEKLVDVIRGAKDLNDTKMSVYGKGCTDNPPACIVFQAVNRLFLHFTAREKRWHAQYEAEHQGFQAAQAQVKQLQDRLDAIPFKHPEPRQDWAAHLQAANAQLDLAGEPEPEPEEETVAAQTEAGQTDAAQTEAGQTDAAQTAQTEAAETKAAELEARLAVQQQDSAAKLVGKQQALTALLDAKQEHYAEQLAAQKQAHAAELAAELDAQREQLAAEHAAQKAKTQQQLEEAQKSLSATQGQLAKAVAKENGKSKSTPKAKVQRATPPAEDLREDLREATVKVIARIQGKKAGNFQSEVGARCFEFVKACAKMFGLEPPQLKGA